VHVGPPPQKKKKKKKNLWSSPGSAVYNFSLREEIEKTNLNT